MIISTDDFNGIYCIDFEILESQIKKIPTHKKYK